MYLLSGVSHTFTILQQKCCYTSNETRKVVLQVGLEILHMFLCESFLLELALCQSQSQIELKQYSRNADLMIKNQIKT